MRFKKLTGILLGGLILIAAGLLGAGDEEPKGTHKEVAALGDTAETKFGKLSTIALTADGKLLAGDSSTSEIKVFSAEGKLLATWKPGVKVSAIHACPDGTVYVGGPGVLAKLDKTGKVLKTVRHQEGNFPRSKVSGLTAIDKDLFATFGRGGSLGSVGKMVRFNRDMGEAKTIAEGLRGCCQRLDLVSKDNVLYLAENTRHRVVKFDREGKKLGSWGKGNRRARSWSLEEFGSCCNPMNLCFGPDGSLYTAESGLGRIKRYSIDGKFLGLVGFAAVPRFSRAGHKAATCSNIAVAVTKDGSRVYVQDVTANVVRVLKKKG